jgi:hypothetical protein
MYVIIKATLKMLCLFWGEGSAAQPQSVITRIFRACSRIKMEHNVTCTNRDACEVSLLPKYDLEIRAR